MLNEADKVIIAISCETQDILKTIEQAFKQLYAEDKNKIKEHTITIVDSLNKLTHATEVCVNCRSHINNHIDVLEGAEVSLNSAVISSNTHVSINGYGIGAIIKFSLKTFEGTSNCIRGELIFDSDL